MKPVIDTLSGTEAELQKERAASLGRAGALLEKALAAFQEAESSGRDVAAAKAEAQKRLWYLVVQREALGLNRHREIYETYAIPPAWRY